MVTPDYIACDRNYFSRASSAAQEDADDAEERAHILVDALSLKKLAVDYDHPDIGVVNTDVRTFICNYFSKSC